MIRWPDTDMTVLACCYIATPGKFKQGCCFVHAGTNVPLQVLYININALATVRYGHAVCCALSGLHAFSGCDSTSSFVGCGKKTQLALISWASDCTSRQAMTLLGICLMCACDLLDIKQLIVCQLYTWFEDTHVHQ